MTDLRTLRFLTAGHVDDGKSTLIGRLLYDMQVIPEDHIVAATDNTGRIDYALFTDGLEDERRQGITIDVAYRFFRHAGIRYRIADTPGHLEYMRNMAVAAVEADIAVILVDAVHGVREQTVSYSKIARFFGVRTFIVAVNKMDALDYEEAPFRTICAEYTRQFEDPAIPCDVHFLPVSALVGDNVAAKSAAMPWYQGAPLLHYLQEGGKSGEEGGKTAAAKSPLRLPIQQVMRDETGTRWYFGTLRGAALTVGDFLRSVDSGNTVTVRAMMHAGRTVQKAVPKSAIAIAIAENVDLSRGAVLAPTHAEGEKRTDKYCGAKAHCQAHLLLLSPEYAGRTEFEGIIKLHHAEVQAFITIDAHNSTDDGADHGADGAHNAHNRADNAATNLTTNGHSHSEHNAPPWVHAQLELAAAIPMDTYEHCPQTGLFLVMNTTSERVAAVGKIVRV